MSSPSRRERFERGRFEGRERDTERERENEKNKWGILGKETVAVLG